MAGKKREDVREEDITGLKYFSKLTPRDPRRKDVRHTPTPVDGTLLKGLPLPVASAILDPRTAKPEAKVRLHAQFDLERAVPIRIDVTEGISRGEADERAVPAKATASGRKPTLRTYEMIRHSFTGLAEEDELPAHVAKLQAHDAQA